jgi:hypothetical protein
LTEREGRLVRLMTALSAGPFRPASFESGDKGASPKGALVTELSLDNVSRLDLEFGQGDLSLALDNWGWFESELKEAVYQSFVSYQREWVLREMIREVPPQSRGNSAGLKGSLRLGERGDPLEVPPGKIVAELSKLRRILAESGSWNHAKMFLVVPLDFYTALAQTDLGKAILSAPDMAVDGELPNCLLGFRVFVADCSPFEADIPGEGLPILAGNRSAFIYSSALTESSIIPSPDGEILSLKAAHGCLAARPEGLALARWSFRLDGG